MRVDENIFYTHLGLRLRALRLKQAPHMSQNELAGKAGFTQRSAIANIEAGAQRPPLHKFYNLCIALKSEPKDVLPTVAEAMTPPNLEEVMVDGKRILVPERAAAFIRRYARSGRKVR